MEINKNDLKIEEDNINNMNIIKNSCYGIWRTMHNEDLDFIKNLNLYDIVFYLNSPNSDNRNIEEGKIKAITTKGINVSTLYGDRFVKYIHVKEVHKMKKNKNKNKCCYGKICEYQKLNKDYKTYFCDWKYSDNCLYCQKFNNY